jgi:hypothetical protein
MLQSVLPVCEAEYENPEALYTVVNVHRLPVTAAGPYIIPKPLGIPQTTDGVNVRVIDPDESPAPRIGNDGEMVQQSEEPLPAMLLVHSFWISITVDGSFRGPAW